MFENGTKQRRLNFAEYEFVHFSGLMAVQVFKIRAQGVFGKCAKQSITTLKLFPGFFLTGILSGALLDAVFAY